MYKQLDLFKDSSSMPERRRTFYCVSIYRLIEWGLMYGVKSVKFKNRGNKMKVFIVFNNGRKFHTRFSKYSFFTPIYYFSLIIQKIRDNEYNDMEHYLNLLQKKLKKPFRKKN